MDYAAWGTEQVPWFRGEPGKDSNGNVIVPLLPRVYRPKPDGTLHDENSLLQFFRMKAPVLGLPIIPERGEGDKWLFLARHVGLPTRLLDWTEGALIALYFAMLGDEPVLWMLNPHALNQKSVPSDVKLTVNAPTLTWFRSDPPDINIYEANFRLAWRGANKPNDASELPVAVHPTNIYPRMSAQQSCFTIHGNRGGSLADMVGNDCLRRYEIMFDRYHALKELKMLGVSHSTLFPEVEGLATELAQFY